MRLPEPIVSRETSRLARGLALLRSRPARYLLAGGWNTLAGYGIFVIFYYLLSGQVHYFIILTIITVINITISFLSYKLFVFRTRGNYLREYLRFYVVYAIPITLGFLLFPVFVKGMKINPYLAQALILVITVIISYFGHKHISFARPRPHADDHP